MENNQPDPKDSIEKQEVVVPEVPNLDAPKKGEPDVVKMEEVATEAVKDNSLDVKAENADAEAQRKESIPQEML
jgi:hypothetical protein